VLARCYQAHRLETVAWTAFLAKPFDLAAVVTVIEALFPQDT